MQVQLLSPRFEYSLVFPDVGCVPQTNLYFFNEIGFSIMVVWLLGYALYTRYIVGRIMMTHVSRDYLRLARFVLIVDAVYTESFLFVVEFVLLVSLVISLSLFSQEEEVVVFAPRFNLSNQRQDQKVLLVSMTNIVRVLQRRRTAAAVDSYYINQAATIALDAVCNDLVDAHYAQEPQTQILSDEDEID